MASIIVWQCDHDDCYAINEFADAVEVSHCEICDDKMWCEDCIYTCHKCGKKVCPPNSDCSHHFDYDKYPEDFFDNLPENLCLCDECWMGEAKNKEAFDE